MIVNGKYFSIHNSCNSIMDFSMIFSCTENSSLFFLMEILFKNKFSNIIEDSIIELFSFTELYSMLTLMIKQLTVKLINPVFDVLYNQTNNRKTTKRGELRKITVVLNSKKFISDLKLLFDLRK